jgi:amino-acid N-acetyltransferase
MEIKYYKPTVKDIVNMQNLVLADVANGNILERSEAEMATTIRSYTVAKIDDTIVGFVALHIHTTELAEIRSLVVDPSHRKKGIGQGLIEHAIVEAKSLHIPKILVLTYQQQLFEKFGFTVILKESLPDTKIWADCIKCKHFPICDEIALTLNI